MTVTVKNIKERVRVIVSVSVSVKNIKERVRVRDIVSVKKKKERDRDVVSEETSPRIPSPFDGGGPGWGWTR